MASRVVINLEWEEEITVVKDTEEGDTLQDVAHNLLDLSPTAIAYK